MLSLSLLFHPSITLFQACFCYAALLWRASLQHLLQTSRRRPLAGVSGPSPSTSEQSPLQLWQILHHTPCTVMQQMLTSSSLSLCLSVLFVGRRTRTRDSACRRLPRHNHRLTQREKGVGTWHRYAVLACHHCPDCHSPCLDIG